MTQTLVLPRRAVLLGGAAFALAGCSVSDLIGPSNAPVQLYALKPSGGAPTTGSKVPWHLSVGIPTATDYLDRSRIALIKPDTSVDYFADSQWTDHLPVLVQEALIEAFENSGRIDGVAAESDGFKADYVLLTDLRDLEARYDQPDGIPTAVVRIEAKIAPTIGRSIVSSLQASHQALAAQNTVAAAVQAMDQALGQALSDIVNWALSQPVPVRR
jgi:cholesterol transport system auxiliary component